MNIFEKVDAFILGYFTKFSHWFQCLTGRTNFFLAYVCLTIWIIDLFVRIGNYWWPLLEEKTTISEVFWHSLFILVSAANSSEIIKADRDPKDIRPSIQVWHISGPFFWLRLFSAAIALIISPVAIYEEINYSGKGVKFFEIYDDAYFFFVVGYYYFLAVDPLPPGTSKVRQWLNSIRMAFSRPVRAESS
ncbi:MAG: hypothetical protein KBC81_01780 [Candidatus Pacebacteria bacterium]|nr:hypothetical protein [Candidatus Paceibacterota bacterium]